MKKRWGDSDHHKTVTLTVMGIYIVSQHEHFRLKLNFKLVVEKSLHMGILSGMWLETDLHLHKWNFREQFWDSDAVMWKMANYLLVVLKISSQFQYV